MNVNVFYSRTVKGRLKLVQFKGEFISRIRWYGFYIELYVMDGDYVEVFYNRYTNKLEDVEILEPGNPRLGLFAVAVNLSDLFTK